MLWCHVSLERALCSQLNDQDDQAVILLFLFGLRTAGFGENAIDWSDSDASGDEVRVSAIPGRLSLGSDSVAI